MTETIVETTGGKVRGTSDGGVHTFLGIPYGGDTSGANRFGPPPPVTPWTGVRDATSFGPSAPQMQMEGMDDTLRTFGGRAEPLLGENCLVLNVWTPGTSASDRPVLVYFHGGGHASGSGSWPAYDGAALAREHGAVVVTLNHRLCLLGYLYLAELGGERYATSGANGVLDLVAALEWVRDNIASFGGDPAKVLAYGESGGGWKLSTLLAMPRARGLFQRACHMSGAGTQGMTPEQGTKLALRTLELLGLDATRLDELHEVPLERLLEAQMSVGMGFGPVLDGTVVLGEPFGLFASGDAPDLPMLIGTCRDEHRTFGAMMPSPEGAVDDDWLVGELTPVLGERAGKLVAGYRATRPDLSPVDLKMVIMTDQWMRIPSIRLAEAASSAGSAPVYMYRFDWESPAMGGVLKAGHGVDYPFFFDNLESATVSSDGPGRPALAAQMTGALVAFARTGDPGHPGLPAWPAYDHEQRATMLFDVTSTVADDPDGAERALWGALA